MLPLTTRELVARCAHIGRVDLEGNPIFLWVLVGFWAGDLGVWSKNLNHREFFEIFNRSARAEWILHVKVTMCDIRIR